MAAQWSSDENITANIEFSHNRSITMLRSAGAGQANHPLILFLISSHDLFGFSADCTRVICHDAPYNQKFWGRNTETFRLSPWHGVVETGICFSSPPHHIS